MTTERREELKGICAAILAEAERRIDDPRNVAKGDGWATMEWGEIKQNWEKENFEFDDALTGEEENGHDPLHEAGDILVNLAQMMDKKAVETIA